MIDFSLSDEHRLLERSIREWGAREVLPFIHDNDRQHHFDRERILGGMAKLGLLGISIPQEYGGAGMDYLALGVASEELEYLDTSLRVIMSVHAVSELPVAARRGAMKSRSRNIWCRRRKATKIFLATASMPSLRAGSDARAIQTTATVKQGDTLRAQRREDLDLAGQRRRSLPGHRLDRPREEEEGRSLRDDGVHRRAHRQGVLERRDEGEVGDISRRIPAGSRWTTSGVLERNVPRPARRGLQDRDVLARSGALTIAAGATGPGSARVPRRQREVRQRAQDVRGGDRPAPAGEGNDRRHGVRLSAGGCDCSGSAPAG